MKVWIHLIIACILLPLILLEYNGPTGIDGIGQAIGFFMFQRLALLVFAINLIWLIIDVITKYVSKKTQFVIYIVTEVLLAVSEIGLWCAFIPQVVNFGVDDLGSVILLILICVLLIPTVVIGLYLRKLKREL